MAKSKTNKDRTQKLNNFKKNVKRMNEQQAQGKKQLLPQTEFQSTDFLSIRGDEVEALEKNLLNCYQSLQVMIQAYQQLIGRNIKEGKIKLTYIWNNGEKATEDEIKAYEEMGKRVEEEKQKRMAQLQQVMASTPAPGEASTNLITPGGQPLTAENLDAEKTIIAP